MNLKNNVEQGKQLTEEYKQWDSIYKKFQNSKNMFKGSEI